MKTKEEVNAFLDLILQQLNRGEIHIEDIRPELEMLFSVINKLIPKEYILCAAIHLDDNKVYVHQPKNIKTGLVICGRRHHNCFGVMLSFNKGSKDYLNVSQGFVTNLDRYVSREEGFDIAEKAGQIKTKVTSSTSRTLISEDMY